MRRLPARTRTGWRPLRADSTPGGESCDRSTHFRGSLSAIAQACDAADFETDVNAKLDLILGDLATLNDAVVETDHKLLSVKAVQRQVIRLLLTPEGRRLP
jgi:hypothetical protein